MIYLGLPYSHPDHGIRDARVQAATLLYGRLVNEGLAVVCPVIEGHAASQLIELPTDWNFWASLDLTILSRCEQMIAYCLHGWESSIGLTHEIKAADIYKIPVFRHSDDQSFDDLVEKLVLGGY